MSIGNPLMSISGSLSGSNRCFFYTTVFPTVYFSRLFSGSSRFFLPEPCLSPLPAPHLHAVCLPRHLSAARGLSCRSSRQNAFFFFRLFLFPPFRTFLLPLSGPVFAPARAMPSDDRYPFFPTERDLHSVNRPCP